MANAVGEHIACNFAMNSDCHANAGSAQLMQDQLEANEWCPQAHLSTKSPEVPAMALVPAWDAVLCKASIDRHRKLTSSLKHQRSLR